MSKSKVLPHVVSEEPIIAWRMWQAVAVLNLFSDDIVYRLRAVSKHTEWKPRITLKADCFALVSSLAKSSNRQVSVHLIGFKHQVPDIYCRCGIYALRTKEKLFNYFTGMKMDPAKPWTVVSANERGILPDRIMGCTVFGQVSLWGEIIEGEDGYRAEYAYPYDLTVLADDRRIADSLREQYQVDTRIELSQAHH
ncbi:MAG: hypothetical protein UU22_C0013G0007 [Parcubacteria group bacterium GW2011_GWA2_40_8]|nr:MAG: hypothetical protein UT82_C0008G0011 [Parcubacteria group bacterium GW2011_GWB1_40_14]KKR78772.1 MAG: hypothetical protein UU22_C0013G0007 [Parcubacteria group bacterium GW2011_GWA2_40_8]